MTGPARSCSATGLVERRARIRAGVDEGERIVLDEIDVHAAHRERRGDREPVDAGRDRSGEGIV
jgi:hypothetical protein